MTNRQARLLAAPMVMIAGSCYSNVKEDFAIIMGFLAFVIGAILFFVDYNKSFKD